MNVSYMSEPKSSKHLLYGLDLFGPPGGVAYQIAEALRRAPDGQDEGGRRGGLRFVKSRAAAPSVRRLSQLSALSPPAKVYAPHFGINHSGRGVSTCRVLLRTLDIFQKL